MFAIMVSLLFATAFAGALLVIGAALYANYDTILSALAGEHVPGRKLVPLFAPRAPRHAQRNLRPAARTISHERLRRAA